MCDTFNWLRIKISKPYYSDGDYVPEYSTECICELVHETGWTFSYKFQKRSALLIVVERFVSVNKRSWKIWNFIKKLGNRLTEEVN